MPSLLSDRISLRAERAYRRKLRRSLPAWAECALQPLGEIPAAHHHLLMARLEALSRGEIDRLMVLMPPGSAKSTYASILFPAWWFTQYPISSIIAASHTADLAHRFGRRVRDLIMEHQAWLGYEIPSGARSASRWRTSAGGEYYASGLRGPITGRRADLAIIDDPIKSYMEAESIRYRDNAWDWYRSELTTRLKPKARVVLIMTRWHEDDLGGRISALTGNEWSTLKLPALAEENDQLGREIGIPLWPEWEDLQALERKRHTVGDRTWSALFQQAPRPNEGSLFKVDCLTFTERAAVDVGELTVRAWDLAATPAVGSNDPDWTVGLKLSCSEVGRYTVLDVVRLRGSPRQVEDAILTTAGADGHNVTIRLPEDPGQAGKTQVSYLTARLTGYHIISSRESGSKVTRALPIASQIEGGNVALVRSDWNRAFVEELRDFPYGRKDDQVDALAQAFSIIINNPKRMRMATISHLAR